MLTMIGVWHGIDLEGENSTQCGLLHMDAGVRGSSDTKQSNQDRISTMF